MPRDHRSSSKPAVSHAHYSFGSFTLPQRAHPVYTSGTATVSKPPVAPAQTIRVEHEQPSLWQNMKSGFGWGVGSQIARNWLGPSQETHYTPSQPYVPTPQTYPTDPKSIKEPIETNKEYQQCILEGGGHEGCKHYLETLPKI